MCARAHSPSTHRAKPPFKKTKTKTKGNDVGPQYRSIILYTSAAQKAAAEAAIARVNSERWYGDAPVVTQLEPLAAEGTPAGWWDAEDYHQVSEEWGGG